MESIDSKVSGTLLQRPIVMTLGGKRYTIPQPTLGTLMLVSELTAQLPKTDGEDSFSYRAMLAKAKYSKVLGEIMATFILGAKAMRKGPALLVRIRIRKIARQVIDSCTPGEIHAALIVIMRNADAKDFFSITTFLEGTSLTAARKVVKTTAPGR